MLEVQTSPHTAFDAVPDGSVGVGVRVIVGVTVVVGVLVTPVHPQDVVSTHAGFRHTQPYELISRHI